MWGEVVLIDFILLYMAGEVELHNVALVSSLALDWTTPDWTRSGRNSLFICTCKYISCIYQTSAFWRVDLQQTATTLWLSSLNTRQGLSFIYHDKMSAPSHTHTPIYCTSSTCICIWNMHDTYVTAKAVWRIRVSCLFCERNSGF